MIAFEKWEGLGNDFIVVHRAVFSPDADAALVRRLCDRRTGIGADGILVVDRAGGKLSMVVRNADGSRPEMCGNGIRCVVGHALLHAHEPEPAGRLFVVQTDSGELSCSVERISDDEVRAEVEMGPARFDEPLLVIAEDPHLFAAVNMGNPHAVTFEPYDDARLERVAPIVERSVPAGTNVEFVTQREDSLVVRVWERGVGFTQACGTGACAVAAEACRRGLATFDAWQRVMLPGGALWIRVAADGYHVRMRGPARRVFSGTTALVA